MMKYLLTCLFLSLLVAGRSQRVVDVDKTDGIGGLVYAVGGEPVSLVKYVRVVDGSPFFNTNWLWGSLIVKGGKRYDTIQLRLDLMADELHYMDNNGNALIATTPVAEIWLNDADGSRYHFVHSSSIAAVPAVDKGWYQLLTDGPVLVFKEFHKDISEGASYGTATKEQTISTRIKYYLFSGDKFTFLKKISEIPELLSDKKEDLEKFIKSNRLNGKSDADYISLLAYYNVLKSK